MTSSAPESRFIAASIDQLRALTQIDVRGNWFTYPTDRPEELLKDGFFSDSSTVPLNEKGHIPWSGGRQVINLAQRLVVPDHLNGYPLAGLTLRLALTWWAEEAQVFVNHQLVQEGDLFDSSARIVLSSSVFPGEEILVQLRLVSPSYDQGALMRSQCIYESTTSIDPGFVADELTLIKHSLETLHPDQLPLVATLIDQINWTVVSDATEFTRSLHQLRQTLQTQLLPPHTKLYLLGHAHLDMAWLWTVKETWTIAQRTFESVLSLQNDFPELIFCHSTPALYAWIEQYRPDLFKIIQQKVNLGVWEVVGGMWVEPDLNLIDGESIVRQVFYAQNYTQEKFGQLTQVAWVPDTFGFTWQLPQILKQGGINYFATQKLHWNDTTQFPHGVFWWQSPDGTQILSLMLPPNVAGVMDTNPITMTSYAMDWYRQTQLKEVFWLPGVGDHGGGPTRDMLEVAKRWQQSPFFPDLEFTTAHHYLQTLEKREPTDHFPVWQDELYLEFHRGTYTTHADQKRWNRRCEGLLYQAELFSSLATIISGSTYPKLELEAAWKNVLFNQFHDILPGTSIPPVFVDANEGWQAVEAVTSYLLNIALKAIAAKIALPSPPQPNSQPILIFNPLNWQRSDVVSISLPSSIGATWVISDLSGHSIPCQLSETSTLLFLAEDIPSIGYRLFWLSQIPETHQDPNPSQIFNPEFILENEYLQVIVDPETGELSRIFDKLQQRDVLKGRGNQLQFFQDDWKYWDAWNIDPNYSQHPLPSPQLLSIAWIEQGPVRSRLRVVRQFQESRFFQDYILDHQSPILKIATAVDWQERHVFVKAAFPLNLKADYATYEIPCGAIQRPTQPQTPAEQAKWEVPSLRWADLTEFTVPLSHSGLDASDPTQRSSPFTNPSTIPTEYGVSLLNDSKYGYDAQSSQLRLTLLRGSTSPDPDADRGSHYFTYAIYPHAGSWQSAQTVHQGYELNFPLQILLDWPIQTPSLNPLPPLHSLLDLQTNHLILMALKPADHAQDQWILRCYECQGESAEFSLNNNSGLRITHPVDILERPLPLPDNQSYQIAPWKIISFAAVIDNPSL